MNQEPGKEERPVESHTEGITLEETQRVSLGESTRRHLSEIITSKTPNGLASLRDDDIFGPIIR